ncbi:MAG: hypothetical protein H6811_03820 [Phycisphaeraceae bacterium]|nr:hypothetical protein [Phycisphaeraceae bacterium]
MEGSPRDGTRTCVVLRPRPAPIPPDLRSALIRRGFDLIDCQSPFLALAHVVAMRREKSTPVVLLVVSPTDASPLLTTLDRYLPGQPCWQYDQSATPALRALDPGRPTPSAAKPPAEPSPDEEPLEEEDASIRFPQVRYPRDRTHAPAPGYAKGATPPLRLIGPTLPADEPSDPERKDPPQSLLTEEELAMLLSDEPPRSSGGLG